ncbi:MAG: hypothetical protein JWN37_134 [Candidatus Nomurabacteria bacterium]|nr:hypothetical protein [Candidatus Nomurabacteria bacterium]
MIYSIAGTNKEVREKAYESLAKLGSVSSHIYSENIATLEPLIESASLFGDKIIANLIQVMDLASARDVVIALLPEMKSSQNIFIIDEPFADANRIKRLAKVSEKLFDAMEEKVKGNDVFQLCNLVAKRDKKQAWIKWIYIRDRETPEAIHGALWWKWTTLWSDVKSGKPSRFTLKECEEIGGKLLRASILAHRGERDLKIELEKVVLSI